VPASWKLLAKSLKSLNSELFSWPHSPSLIGIRISVSPRETHARPYGRWPAER
jgi:hypothetical protein